MSYSLTRTRRTRWARTDLLVCVAILGAALLPEAVGVLTTLPPFSGWYLRAPHPAWALPTWVYLTVWPVVYLLCGVAGSLTWLRGSAPVSSLMWVAYLAHLVLQCVWPIAFLAQGLVDGAALWVVFGVIVLLDLVTLVVVVTFWRVSRAAAALMGLVLVWLLFGSALSFGETVLISLTR